jgi:hypothetical protein
MSATAAMTSVRYWVAGAKPQKKHWGVAPATLVSAMLLILGFKNRGEADTIIGIRQCRL